MTILITVDGTTCDRVNCMPSQEEERGFLNVHVTLEALLKAIPL
jgi:RNA polymerase I-specific transcription initiation factor RRN3